MDPLFHPVLSSLVLLSCKFAAFAYVINLFIYVTTCPVDWGCRIHRLYEVHTISFQTFFVWAFKIVVDSWERYAIKFCSKLGKNATEPYGMLQTAFGASCMNRESVFEWHKRFKEDTESVRDYERCGRTKEVNTPELIGQRVRVRVTMFRF